MLRNLITGVAFVYIVIFLGGCEGENDKLEIKTGLVARIGDQVIKEREFEERIKSLPSSQKRRFRGEIGRAKLVDEMIKERMLYMAALENKLQYNENIKIRLNYTRQTILIQALYAMLADNIECSDEMIKEYYDNNQIEFKTESTIKAQHIFSRDSLKVVEWKKRIDSSKDTQLFSRIAKEESEDSLTAPKGGLLGYFNPYGFIKFVGKDERFGNAVDWLSVKEVSGVIAYDKGYSIVKVLEKKPAVVKPVEDVREIISNKIKSSKLGEVIEEELYRLERKYKTANYIREELIKNTKSAKELWELAQDENSPENKILFYTAIFEGYPDHKFAPQAMFMTAFTYSEEMSDFVFARRYLSKLFDKYPDSEIIESAKWLEKNMGKKTLNLDSMGDIDEEIKKE